jgi:membrane protein DedA with SNARE-associated domain
VIEHAALWKYLTVFSALVAAGLGFPIPEEVPIVGAGIMVGHSSGHSIPDEVYIAASAFGANPQSGFHATINLCALVMEPDSLPIEHLRLHWWIMLPLCILGVVISDGLLYGIGRFWGPRLLDTRWMKKLLPPAKRMKVEENFHQYGVMVLLFARFLPTIRSPIFIMAGIMRIPLSRFLLADGLYAIPGVSLLFFLSYWFGEQFRTLVEAAEGKVQAARPILILVAIAAVAGYLFHHFMRHPVATGDPREEIPVIGGQVAHKMNPGGDAAHSGDSKVVHVDGAAKTHQPASQAQAPATNQNETR